MSNTKNKIPPQFIVSIETKDDTGRARAREFITYAGLLAVAHELGLDEINSTILQMPTDANGQAAVVRAVAKGKPGLFTGLGDASPQNVNRKVVRHLLRVAETRAKARALRDLCNINMLALEELGGDDDVDFEPAPRPPVQQREQRRDHRSELASDNQKRALWRRALALGHEGQQAHAFLTTRLGMDPAKASREQASKLLDALGVEERARLANGANGANGSGHAAE